MAAGAGAWSSLSDRNVKTAISVINPLDVLDQLGALVCHRNGKNWRRSACLV
jgi:hypothetical protein